MQVNIRHLSAINKYAASTEATRYCLNGVYIHTDTSWVYAVATDGHRMIVHRFPNAENVDWNFIIPSRAFNSFKFKKNDLGLGEMNFQNGEIVFSVEGDITRVKPVDGTFPDYMRVRPADGVEIKVAHFNGAYVFDFDKFAKEIGASYATITPRGDSPALVTFNGDENTYGALMPRRAASAMRAPF